MHTFRMVLGVALLAVLAVGAGCPAAGTGRASGSASGSGSVTGERRAEVNPDACGKINTTDAGRRLYAFLVATAALQKEVLELQKQAKRACLNMAAELKLPQDQLAGDTRFVCHNVAVALRDNLAAAQKQEHEPTFEVVYKPAQCVVDLDVAAKATAECEARAEADVRVSCQGSCQGTCTGECDGTCSARGDGGKCAGKCTGTCRGSCTGGCDGSADVDADASCEASGELRANLDATCTDPVMEIKYDDGTVTDPAKMELVTRALNRGLPQLLLVAAQVQGPVASAVATWGKSVAALSASSAKLADQLGDAGICVLGQIGSAFAALAEIEVQVQVTIEASVEVGGAARASSR